MGKETIKLVEKFDRIYELVKNINTIEEIKEKKEEVIKITENEKSIIKDNNDIYILIQENKNANRFKKEFYRIENRNICIIKNGEKYYDSVNFKINKKDVENQKIFYRVNNKEEVDNIINKIDTNKYTYRIEKIYNEYLIENEGIYELEGYEIYVKSIEEMKKQEKMKQTEKFLYENFYWAF